MAIYNIFDFCEKEDKNSAKKEHAYKEESSFDPSIFRLHSSDKDNDKEDKKSSFFSAVAARFFFFFLLIADLFWGIYSLIFFFITMLLCCVTFFRLSPIKASLSRSYINVKRAIVCALALVVAIFSPALGIMFSCMYFLMYDREGVDEIVPTSIRDQFRVLFP